MEWRSQNHTYMYMYLQIQYTDRRRQNTTDYYGLLIYYVARLPPQDKFEGKQESGTGRHWRVAAGVTNVHDVNVISTM